MTIRVKLPNGQYGKFPDGTPHEEIESVLRKQFPPQNAVEPESEEQPSTFQKALSAAANSPVTEAAISAGPAFVNAIGNVANAIPEVFFGKKPFPKLQRPFAEPTEMAGQIGSKIGDIAGSGLALALAPGASTIRGGLAAGFAEGEGGFMDRLKDSLLGSIIPGALHAGKFGKSFLDSRKIGKNIKSLNLEKAAADQGVFSSKEALANKLNTELAPTKSKKDALTSSLENLAGNSESAAKESVGKLFKKAEKDITSKFKGLYEGFNSSKAGQSAVKEPVKITELESEYGLKPSDFSSDTRGLIDKLVGKIHEIPESEQISVGTGKPITEASTKYQNAANPKVSDYINLWKQLRSEISEFRHSASKAETPEAKRAFREKANNLEKFSDKINSKTFQSLDKTDAKKYADIQKGYMNEKVPFMEKTLLKNATDKFPEVPDNVFEKLNKLGTPEFVKALKNNHPELVDAIAKHDIRDISKMNTAQLKDLKNGDFSRFVPESIRNTISALHGTKGAEDMLRDALKKVQTTEIGRKVKASDISDIIKSRPDLAKPFKNVEQEQKRLRNIKNALVDAGFKLKDAEDKLKKFKSIKSLATTGSAGVGSYLGIKKSRLSDNDSSDN